MSITNIYVAAAVVFEKGSSGLRRSLKENLMYMTGLMRGKLA
jgi:hypothetical protein